MLSNISGVKISATERPTNTSAFLTASSKESSFLAVANSAFSTERFSLSFRITPLLSTITIFSSLAPRALYNRVQEIAAAPAPLITIETSSNFLFAISKAFKSAAAEIIAVPC